MRLRYQKPVDRAELEKLKYKIGDHVIFEGKTYQVTQVGLRYVYAIPIDNPTAQPCLLYIKTIVRWMPPDPEPEENDPKYDLKD